jgi:hypothetical protein
MNEEVVNQPTHHPPTTELGRKEGIKMANATEIKNNAPAGSMLAKLSTERIQEMLDKEEKYDRATQRAKEIGTRLRIKSALLIAKARKAGLVVSAAEVDAEMKRRNL